MIRFRRIFFENVLACVVRYFEEVFNAIYVSQFKILLVYMNDFLTKQMLRMLLLEQILDGVLLAYLLKKSCISKILV